MKRGFITTIQSQIGTQRSEQRHVKTDDQNDQKSSVTKITVICKPMLEMLWHFDRYHFIVDTIQKSYKSASSVATIALLNDVIYCYLPEVAVAVARLYYGDDT